MQYTVIKLNLLSIWRYCERHILPALRHWLGLRVLQQDVILDKGEVFWPYLLSRYEETSISLTKRTNSIINTFIDRNSFGLRSGLWQPPIKLICLWREIVWSVWRMAWRIQVQVPSQCRLQIHWALCHWCYLTRQACAHHAENSTSSEPKANFTTKALWTPILLT